MAMVPLPTYGIGVMEQAALVHTQAIPMLAQARILYACSSQTAKVAPTVCVIHLPYFAYKVERQSPSMWCQATLESANRFSHYP